LRIVNNDYELLNNISLGNNNSIKRKHPEIDLSILEKNEIGTHTPALGIKKALQAQGNINIFTNNKIDYDALSKVLDLGSGDGVWPPVAVRRALQPTYPNFTIKTSQVEGIGNGLFTNSMIKTGQVIGVYGGVFRDTITEYTLDLDYDHYDKRGNRTYLDGTPSGQLDYTIFGYMNDFIWDQSWTNCKLTAMESLEQR
jgi:hypothetical protein